MKRINGNIGVSDFLAGHGIRPTANRILIAEALLEADRPLGLTDLEDILETIDKSNIFRTLSLFREKHAVHVMEDGGDSVKYEICHSPGEEDEDLHAHFFCTSCHRTFCLEEIPVPMVELPEGFSPESVNFMIKGVCPNCNRG